VNTRPEPPPADVHMDADAKDHSRIYQVGRGTMIINGRCGPTPVVMPIVADHAPPPAVFVGRDEQVNDLLQQLDPARSGQGVTMVSAVAGLAGVGKTTLARHVATMAVEKGWFRGGAVMVDLHGYDPAGPIEAGQVFGPLLHGLGLPGEQVPATEGEQAAVYHRLLTELGACGKPVLLVLDNVSSLQQCADLLPRHSLHRVLVTSRHSLDESALTNLELEVLSPDEAAGLLTQALRRRRPGDPRVTGHTGRVAVVAELCGWLPLALQIIAALLADDTDLTIEDLLSELRSPPDRLAVLTHGDTAVGAAFELSWRHLSRHDQQAARLFRLLTASPGPDITTEIAAVLAGEPQGVARRHLRALRHAHLIEPTGAVGRWRMHDLVRLYATELSLTRDGSDERDAALDRLLDHFRERVTAAHTWLQPDAAKRAPNGHFASREQALCWLDGERPNLVAAAAAALQARRWRHVCGLAEYLSLYLDMRHHVEDWLRLGGLALDAARHIGPGHTRAAAGLAGNACRVARRFDEAVTCHQQALDLAIAAGDRMDEGRCLHNLGLTYFRMGRHREAETCHRRDMAICIAMGDLPGAAQSMVALGDALRAQQRFDRAVEVLDRAVTVLTRCDDTRGVMTARMNLALTWLDWRSEGNERAGYVIWQLCTALKTAVAIDACHAQAVIFMNLSQAYLSRCQACHADAPRQWAHRAAASFKALRDPFLEAKAVQAVALAEAALGDADGAVRHQWQAAGILDGLGEAEEAERGQRPVLDMAAIRSRSLSGCPHESAEDKEFTAWLEDLPYAVLRGDDQLGKYQFAGGMVFGGQTSARQETVGPDDEATAEAAEPNAEEPLALLRELTGLVDDPAGRDVAEALGQLPRALTQAAAVIRREHLTFSAYLERLRSIPAAKYPNRSQVDPALRTSIVLNVESAEACHGQVARILDVLAVSAAEGIDRRLLRAVFAPQKAAAIDNALGLLTAASLVTAASGGTVVTIDPAVQQVARDRARERGSLLSTATHVATVLEDECGRLISRKTEAVDNVLRFSLQIDALWAAVKPELPGTGHDGLAEMILRLRAWQVSMTASILATRGAPGAVALAGTSAGIRAGLVLVEDCERLLGQGHPETWRARNNLAGVYGAGAAQYDQACALLVQNLRAANPPDATHPEILTTRHNLGFMHLRAGRPRRARQVLGGLLTDRERVLGTDHPDTHETRQLLEIAQEALTRRD
jgi:tetratricopeptide (TPR) repeat protein/DNA-binding transcriptional ArsR family regulator